MCNKPSTTNKTVVCLCATVLFLTMNNHVFATTIAGRDLGWDGWVAKTGWSWGLPNGLMNWGWGRYELWNVAAKNNGQPYVWYSGQKGPGDEAFYNITEYGFTTPGIKSDHLYGPATNNCCEGDPIKHSMDFTTAWTESQGIDLTSSLSFSFGEEFKAKGVGLNLGFTVSEGITFSNAWTYGESITHHFDLVVPPPDGSGEDGYRTRDFFLDYRGALWVWSGKLRGVVYDDSNYSVLDNYVIPQTDPDVFIFHFERTAKSEVYTEQHKACVPEPGIVALFVSGIALLGGMSVWRRSKLKLRLTNYKNYRGQLIKFKGIEG